jgi:hypothetical protein
MSPRAIRKVSAHFACARSANDGTEPWSEDDLFGLDSGLAFGGDIEEIANFLGRDVEEVRRKASERGWSTE